MSVTRVVLPRLAEFGGVPTNNLDNDTSAATSSQHKIQRYSSGHSSVTPTLIKRVGKCQITRPPKTVADAPTNLTKANSTVDLALSGIPRDKNLLLPKIDEDVVVKPSPWVAPHTHRSKHRFTTSSLFPEPPPTPSKSGTRLNIELAIMGQDIRLPPPRTPTESRKQDTTKKPRKIPTHLKRARSGSSGDLQHGGGVLAFQENIRKLLLCTSLGVHIESKYQASGNIATPVFHCPRCLKHWTMYNVTPNGCRQTERPTKGPSFFITNTGHSILKTFQSMPKEHQSKFLDTIIAIEPDSKGIIHVPSVDYVTIAMSKRSSNTLHGRQAELIPTSKTSTDTISPADAADMQESRGHKNSIMTSEVPTRLCEPPFEQRPTFIIRVHKRQINSAMGNVNGGGKQGVTELMDADDRPNTSIGHRENEDNMSIVIGRKDNSLTTIVYDSDEIATGLVDEQQPDTAITGVQFAPDGTYYTGIYSQDGKFIPTARTTTDGRRQSGLLGPDGRFYAHAYYGKDGRLNARKSSPVYDIGFVFLNANQIQQNNLQSIEHVADANVTIGQHFDEIRELSNLRHHNFDKTKEIISRQPKPTDLVDYINKPTHNMQAENWKDSRFIKNVFKQNDKTDGDSNEEYKVDDDRKCKNDVLTNSKDQTIQNNSTYEGRKYSANEPSKKTDNMSSIINKTKQIDEDLPNTPEIKRDKENEVLDLKDDNVKMNEGSHYTYSDESFHSLIDQEDSITERKHQEYLGEDATIPVENRHTSSHDRTKQSSVIAEQSVTARQKQRRDSTFNYMGVKDKTAATDSKESLSSGRNKDKEIKKSVIKNKAVKNVTGKPDTKPGYLQKHMFATPEESLAKTSAVLGASGKKKGTKLVNHSAAYKTPAGGNIPVISESRDASPTNITSDVNKFPTKIPGSELKRTLDKRPEGQLPAFKPEKPESDIVMKDRISSSLTEKRKDTLPALPGISTKQGNEYETTKRKPKNIVKKAAKSKRKTVGKAAMTTKSNTDTSDVKDIAKDDDQEMKEEQLRDEQPGSMLSSDINIMFQGDLLPKLQDTTTSSSSTPSHRMTYSTLPSTFGELPKLIKLATISNQKINSTGDSEMFGFDDKQLEVVEEPKVVTEIPIEHPQVKGYMSSPVSMSTVSATSSQESVFESVSEIWRKHDDELIKLQKMEINGGISILNFTPAFRFSLFQIPHQYVEYNKQLSERARMIRFLKKPRKAKRKVVKKVKSEL
ncbi:uncharacterized protein [Antedon mediterranea]|uniref:uncharacterized protein n=1 Tax=Antedon mediterranea TaxID=105859 RepID=UPI003AF97C2D